MSANSPSSKPLGRRRFLQRAVTVSVAAPAVMSLEEHRLLARAAGAGEAPGVPKVGPSAALPKGRIGKVTISRLLCGGNLISGYAHSRDLIYVSELLKHYFSDDRIMDTWALCEQHGIDTMVASPSDPHAVAVYRKYRDRGGRIQYLAQMDASRTDLKTCVKQAVDAGAVGAFLVGNQGDQWTREGAVGAIGELVANIRAAGLIAGVAGHEVRTPLAVEKAGIEPDFYVKTLHPGNYWSRRPTGQEKDVIDNYGIDNYWCKDPEETIRRMGGIERPWIAYKVLAAGAIAPRAGFRYAFQNGADFALVGMFDFQVAENAAVAAEALRETRERERDWMA